MLRESHLQETMIIDLHIHTSTGSDGALPVEKVIAEARSRNITFMAITDHDSVLAQEKAIALDKGEWHRLYHRCGVKCYFSAIAGQVRFARFSRL